MTNTGQEALREKIVEILKTLSEQERILLNKLLKIEQENLHVPDSKNFTWKEDLLKGVREVFK